MLKKAMMVLLLPFLLILLTGCENSKVKTPKIITKIKIVKQQVPSELLNCDSLPEVPTITMQSEVADYTVRLYKVADQCKDKINSIKEFLDDGKKTR